MKNIVRKYYLLLVIWAAIVILIRESFQKSNWIFAVIALMAAVLSVYIWKILHQTNSNEQ